jgi:hypothetical protein
MVLPAGQVWTMGWRMPRGGSTLRAGCGTKWWTTREWQAGALVQAAAPGRRSAPPGRRSLVVKIKKTQESTPSIFSNAKKRITEI